MILQQKNVITFSGEREIDQSNQDVQETGRCTEEGLQEAREGL